MLKTSSRTDHYKWLYALGLSLLFFGTACAQPTNDTAAPSVTHTSSQNSKSEASAHDDHDHDHDRSPASAMTELPPYTFTVAPDDHIIGDESAPVDVIIYASVTCGHCAKWFSEQWPTFKAEQIDTGRVRLIFREFLTAPIEIVVPNFFLANCAAPDAFMDHIVHQMQNQAQFFKALSEGEAKERFFDYAERAGLTTEEDVNQCLSKEVIAQRLQTAMTRAQAAGLRGVPGFIINGHLYEGHDTDAQTLGSLIAKEMDQ